MFRLHAKKILGNFTRKLQVRFGVKILHNLWKKNSFFTLESNENHLIQTKFYLNPIFVGMLTIPSFHNLYLS